MKAPLGGQEATWRGKAPLRLTSEGQRPMYSILQKQNQRHQPLPEGHVLKNYTFLCAQKRVVLNQRKKDQCVRWENQTIFLLNHAILNIHF
jgi:hypothetical protein